MYQQRAQLQTCQAFTTVAARKSSPSQKNIALPSARKERPKNAAPHTRSRKKKELRSWKKEKGSEKPWQKQEVAARTANENWEERVQSCSTASREWSSNDNLIVSWYSLHHWNFSSPRVICVERKKDIVETLSNHIPYGTHISKPTPEHPRPIRFRPHLDLVNDATTVHDLIGIIQLHKRSFRLLLAKLRFASRQSRIYSFHERIQIRRIIGEQW